MKELKMKAMKGVTLVELLVVILIVTILSVSMLPLLQPFVIEAQYAAEPIPVIGNLRTKIGLYEYDKGNLPNDWISGQDIVHTCKVDDDDPEKFEIGQYTMGATCGQNVLDFAGTAGEHLGNQIDVNYKDLKGKRSKPSDYQYYVLSATNNTSYVIGCFGSGNKGLKAGTGYAVCELNYPSKKYIGTWKRYKPDTTNAVAAVVQFVTDPANTEGCYVPDVATFTTDLTANDTGLPSEVANMKAAGWEF